MGGVLGGFGGVGGYEGEEDQRELTASLTQHFSSAPPPTSAAQF